jgi:hypothetical protein
MPKEEAGLGIWMVVRDCTAATSESKQVDERITRSQGLAEKAEYLPAGSKQP